MLFALWWVNLAGLILSIIGSTLLFFGTPRDTPEIPTMPISSTDYYFYYKDLNIQKEYEKVNKRQGISQWGFGLIWLGFLLQIIPQFFQYPHK